jgi:hypothetical protein
MGTVSLEEFEAFKSSVLADLTALRTSIMTTQATLDVDVGVATDTFAAQGTPPPLVTTPGAPAAGGFPGVAHCPAAVPGAFSLALSGMQMLDAEGKEFLRIWGTDPRSASYNSYNLYVGAEAGLNQPIENVSSSAFYNAGIGTWAMKNIVGGSNNVAVGAFAMGGTGPDPDCCTAVGSMALWRGEGNYNDAFGNSALAMLTTGQYNAAFGIGSLMYATLGNENVALGSYCGVGSAVLKDSKDRSLPEPLSILPDDVSTVDSQLVLVGHRAGRSPVTGSTDIPIVNAIAIGNRALFDKSNTAVIGNVAVTDVYFGSTAAQANVHAKGLTLSALPTAAAGLAPGTLWNNAGVVNVAP